MNEAVLHERDRAAHELAKAALWKDAWDREDALSYSRFFWRPRRHKLKADRRYRRALAAYRRAEWAALIVATA